MLVVDTLRSYNNMSCISCIFSLWLKTFRVPLVLTSALRLLELRELRTLRIRTRAFGPRVAEGMQVVTQIPGRIPNFPWTPQIFLPLYARSSCHEFPRYVTTSVVKFSYKG